MTFTAGLLLVFLNVFLSGLIFLRFYFIGEFSKQFNTRVPMTRLAFYSLIPGIVLLSVGIAIYSVFDKDFSISGALHVYADLLGADGEFKPQTCTFLDEHIHLFAYFNMLIYMAAGIFGLLLHFIIQKFDLDKRMKIFRFKNYWYYVFSGEILKFKKFIRASANVKLATLGKNRTAIITYADALCDVNGQSKLYRGYVVDYELDSDNMHHLDKIYLLDAVRYETNAHSRRGLIEETVNQKIDIQGDLFVIDYKNVINLNLTYVPSIDKLKDIRKAKDKKSRRLIVLISLFMIVPLHLFFIDAIWTHFIIPEKFIKVFGLDGFVIKLILTSLSLNLIAIFFSGILKLMLSNSSKRTKEHVKAATESMNYNTRRAKIKLAMLEILSTDQFGKKIGNRSKEVSEKLNNSVKFAGFSVLLIVVLKLFGF